MAKAKFERTKPHVNIGTCLLYTSKEEEEKDKKAEIEKNIEEIDKEIAKIQDELNEIYKNVDFNKTDFDGVGLSLIHISHQAYRDRSRVVIFFCPHRWNEKY